MKKLSLIKPRIQSLFDWILFILFPLNTEIKIKPTIFYDGFINKDRQLLKQAALNFELKKRGQNEKNRI